LRLVTRADFDGLACAVLLTELGLMDNWLFVHPKDVQDGKYPGLPDDVVCNVPYIPGCGYWFDHHSSEEQRLAGGANFKGAARPAPSCARLVWEYHGGEQRFGSRFNEMLHYVDKVDSGDLNLTEVLHPEGWVLLGFIMDPRTGLGRYRYFTISNYRLMEDLIGYIRTMPVDEILEQPDVAERVERYFMQETHFRNMLLERITIHGNVIVLDTRGMDEVPPGNRFTMYSLFPECNASIQVLRGRSQQNTVLSVGHSILNRTCRSNVGRLMLRYGGGGHFQVGTCQVANHLADEVIAELLEELDESGAPSPEETAALA
jgi:nanoRNase/pAp phosphatase (c-di-AMP/oligoRNAs hydrolase)